jgi:predicted nucleic acid-binding protein
MKRMYTYEWTRFSPEVIKEATNKLFEGVDIKDKPPFLYLSVQLDEGIWKHDNEEEFFSDYRRSEVAGFVWTA